VDPKNPYHRRFGLPALVRDASGRLVSSDPGPKKYAERREPEFERQMAPIRERPRTYRALMPGLSAGRSDEDFIAAIEDRIRDANGLGPTSEEGRAGMIRRVVAWASVNTSLARRCIPLVGSSSMSNAVWVETLRSNLLDCHAEALSQPPGPNHV